jgi:HTH-type transcriptional regulator / antitoxin HigA
MGVRRIGNEEEYREPLGTVSALVDLDLAPGLPDGDRLVALVKLIEQYEAPFMQQFRCASR